MRSCNAEYLLPARLDDPIIVRTRIRELRGASLRAVQTVARRESDGAEKVLVELVIRLVCMDGELKPARLPGVVRAALGDLVEGQ